MVKVMKVVNAGEKKGVKKASAPAKPECVPTVTDRDNYLFMGTSVVSGAATAVVVKTGGTTEYRSIVKKLAERDLKPSLKEGWEFKARQIRRILPTGM
jgi:magnesium-transporting ATPase (P-type)